MLTELQCCVVCLVTADSSCMSVCAVAPAGHVPCTHSMLSRCLVMHVVAGPPQWGEGGQAAVGHAQGGHLCTEGAVWNHPRQYGGGLLHHPGTPVHPPSLSPTVCCTHAVWLPESCCMHDGVCQAAHRKLPASATNLADGLCWL